MRLPDFRSVQALNDLRERMGAEYRETGGSLWESIDAAALAVQLGVGIEVGPDDVEIAEDGTLEYKGQKVLVYIRDWRAAESEPKYHVADCPTLTTMRRDGRYDRYVATNDTGGMFDVNWISDSVVYRRERNYPLDVCKRCLTRVDYEGYRHAGEGKQGIFDGFSLDAYFDQYSPRISHIPRKSAKAPHVDARPANSAEIHREYKRRNGWKCEECGLDLRPTETRRWLHVHHISGTVSDNTDANLRALCIACHREQGGYGHATAGGARDWNLFANWRRRSGNQPAQQGIASSAGQTPTSSSPATPSRDLAPEIRRAVGDLLPDIGLMDRNDLIDEVAARLPARLARREVRKRVNRFLADEVRAGRLKVDDEWESVWRA